jgi:Arc/MetJ-type ribon-helix-helix transcriptional regulator
MKQKLSITIEEETIERLGDYVSEGCFRNKSHVVEFALNKFIKEKENENTNS